MPPHWASRPAAGAFPAAAKHDLIIVCPDTSPRGAKIAGESDSYDFGEGAGFYLDATREPWKKHYKMYSFVIKELISLLERSFCGIFPHSLHSLHVSISHFLPFSLKSISKTSLFLATVWAATALYCVPSKTPDCFVLFPALRPSAIPKIARGAKRPSKDIYRRKMKHLHTIVVIWPLFMMV
eukprot:Sdes_comp20489_c0_seq4m14898